MATKKPGKRKAPPAAPKAAGGARKATSAKSATPRKGVDSSTALRDAVHRFVVALDARKIPSAEDRRLIAVFLRQMFQLPPAITKTRGRKSRTALDLRSKENLLYRRIAAMVRQRLLDDKSPSANHAYEMVGQTVGRSSATVRRAFASIDGFASLATDLPAYRAAIKAAHEHAVRARVGGKL